MPRSPLDLPPDVACAFMADLDAYFAAETGFDKDAIAARQLRVLRDYLRPSDGKLRTTDVRALFEALRQEAEATGLAPNKKPGARGHRGRAR